MSQIEQERRVTEEWYKVDMWVIGLEEPPTDNLQFRKWINGKHSIIDDLVVRPAKLVPVTRASREIRKDVISVVTKAQRQIQAIRGRRPLLFSDRLLIADRLMQDIPELGLVTVEDDALWT